jgi:micrococcal nuclease
VRIERDVVARDDYGRLLGYVHRDSEHGGEFVNLEILRGGFAVPLTIEPNSTYRAEFVEATRRAQALGLGLWSACSTPPIGPVASPP